MKEENYNFKFVVWSSIGAFALAVLFHFLYHWIPLPFLGVFFPVNESVWEHLKLCFYPILLVWVLPWGEIFPRWHKKGEKGGWLIVAFSGAAVSVTVAGMIVLTWYYTLSAGFLVHGIWVDLLLLGIGTILGQSLGLYVTWRSFKTWQWAAVVYLIIVAAAFGVLAFYPPKLPVFVISTH